MVDSTLRICEKYVLQQLQHIQTGGGTGSGVPESTPAGFCVFLSDPEPKIREKPDRDPESLFHFGNSRSLCGSFLSENKGKLRLDR